MRVIRVTIALCILVAARWLATAIAPKGGVQ